MASYFNKTKLMALRKVALYFKVEKSEVNKIKVYKIITGICFITLDSKELVWPSVEMYCDGILKETK